MNYFTNWLQQQGLTENTAQLLGVTSTGVLLIIGAIIIDFIAKKIILKIVETLVRKSRTNWDDALVERKVFNHLAHIAPAIFIHAGSNTFASYTQFQTFVQTASMIFIAAMCLAVINAFLNACLDIYRGYEISKRFPLKAIIQVLKFFVFFLGGISIFSTLLGKSPLLMLSGLGAFSAVLILVFKDAILGLVAGFQLTTNDMVRPGDWIEMPRFGANGDVIDVSLTTVSVQNFDKTISTIPTYALISDSFKNWRGMSDSSGRRIKRNIYIDMNSICFCDESMLERFKKFNLLVSHVTEKSSEIDDYNATQPSDHGLDLNGRRLTNLGCFRAYVENYLRENPNIHKGMTFLVRQLDPSSQGLPIQLYVFSKDQNWNNYEAIQADIFDHLLASISLFDLKIFQEPSGADIRESILAAKSSKD